MHNVSPAASPLLTNKHATPGTQTNPQVYKSANFLWCVLLFLGVFSHLFSSSSNLLWRCGKKNGKGDSIRCVMSERGRQTDSSIWRHLGAVSWVLQGRQIVESYISCIVNEWYWGILLEQKDLFVLPKHLDLWGQLCVRYQLGVCFARIFTELHK